MIRELMVRRPDLTKSVSCTTRSSRPGEREGEDYRFISTDQFAQMRDAGDLLEWATVHRDLSYGTPRAPVDEALAAGKDVILEIDYQGARSVRGQVGGRAVLIFVAPPSWKDLHSRLDNRDTESREDVRKRLRTARCEIAHMDLFEYVIVNDDLSRAVDELEAILIGERRRLVRSDWRALRTKLLDDAIHE